MTILRTAVITATVCAGAMSLSACDPIDEKVCSRGDYPVTAADGSGGQTCATSGQPIPSGYTTFAPGHTPTTPGTN